MKARGMALSWLAWCAVYLALSAAFFSDSRTHAAALNDEIEAGTDLRLLYRQERWLWVLGLLLGLAATALWIRALHAAGAATAAKASVIAGSISAIVLATVALQSTWGRFLADPSGQDMPAGSPDELAARAGCLTLLAFGLVVVLGVAVTLALRSRQPVGDASAAAVDVDAK